MQTCTFIVDDKKQGTRLDIFLTDALASCPSRNFVKNLIAQGSVTVNDRQAKPHQKLHNGDTVIAVFPESQASRIAPEQISLNIFYEDEDILVVNKPIGMTVHPGSGCRSGTLVNALVYHQKELSKTEDPLRPGIVHRLDKETSGLMVVAKNNAAHAHLAKQFERHLVMKQYVAIVEGIIEFDEGLIDAPLGRHPIYREKRSVLFSQAKEAQTVYRVLKRFEKTTLVSLLPKTGRTHQLRVHMKYLGHSILGDEKYGKKMSFSRMALHAQSIGFQHPQTLRYIEFSSVLPVEFCQYILMQATS